MALAVGAGLGLMPSRALADESPVPAAAPAARAPVEPVNAPAAPSPSAPAAPSSAAAPASAAAPSRTVVLPPSEPAASLPGGPLLAPTVAATAEEQEPPLPVRRPGFSISAALGISLDNQGVADGRNVAIPSFSVQGGIGQDLLGFDARLFASEAAGQFSTPVALSGDAGAKTVIADVGADRQAVDLMLAIRPFARWQRQRLDWPARFAHALTVDVGAAGERVSIGAQTIKRIGAVVAAYADLPVTPAGDTSALHLRLTARRMIGTHGDIPDATGSRQVGDTRAELLAGLAVVF